MKFTAALTLLFFEITSPVFADSDEAAMACLEIFKPTYVDAMCCENLSSVKMFEDNPKCNKKETSEEWTCPDYECFLNTQSLLENGKIIEDKASAFLDDIAKKNPKEKNVVERVKMACLEGQYEEYPPDEDCMALKFYVCVYTNTMLECDSWKKDKICTEASNLVKKCKEAK